MHLIKNLSDKRKRRDLLGQVFGDFSIVEGPFRHARKDGKGTLLYWMCRCNLCGAQKKKAGQDLVAGRCITCACHGPVFDYTGMSFGALRVVNLAEDNNLESGERKWLCQCRCGKQIPVLQSELREGVIKGCGCGLIVRLEPGEAAKRDAVKVYRRNAERRGFAWELTDAQAVSIMKQSCHYCGQEPSTFGRSRTRTIGLFLRNGIDRLDSTAGYTVANCVPCCKTCNIMKLNMNVSDFLNIIARIYLHTNKKRTMPTQERIQLSLLA